MRNFQLIVIGLFLFFIVAGVVVFSTSFRGGGNAGEVPISATVWGTLDASMVTRVINQINLARKVPVTVTYRQIRGEDFDRTLIEAIASGNGPDAIFLSQDLVLRYADKVTPIPFESVSERTVRDTFIQEGELFLTPAGSLALPVLVDPIVLYWNRTIFSNEGVATPPVYWDEFLGLSEKFTKKDAAQNITQSAIPFGEFSNVLHAKEILAGLILQAGSPIVRRTKDGRLDVLLSDRLGFDVTPAESALRFYTEFSNPVKPAYSWNRSLPVSTDAFLAGTVALYPGFASELFTLREQNPNLNFDVAPLPQIRDTTARKTFGMLYGIAVLKSSSHQGGAFALASLFAGNEASGYFEEASGLPSARRDLLAKTPSDAFRVVLYKSALIATAFLDPNPVESKEIFARMIEDVTSGRALVPDAVRQGNSALMHLVQ